MFFFSALFLLMPLSVSAEPIVAAYYENYAHYRPSGQRPMFSAALVDPKILDELHIAFAYFGYATPSANPEKAGLTGNFKIQPTEPDDIGVLYPSLSKLKQQAPQLKLYLTIGGWSFNNPDAPTKSLFSEMVSRPESRREFIASCIDYAHRFDFNGIDIDWEYPGDPARGGSSLDFENFIQFLKECRDSFASSSPTLSLSCAFPAHPPFGLKESEQKQFYRFAAECSKYLDHLTVMAYDYHGPFENSKLTGVNAPLNRDTDPLSPFFIRATLDNYLQGGVQSEKILLGIPTFGRSFGDVSDLTPESAGPGKPFEKPGLPGPATRQPGLLAYFEISDMILEKSLISRPDALTSTVYGFNPQTKLWVSFDSPASTALKAELARAYRLKGIIFWSINMDEYTGKESYPNIRSGRAALAPLL
ncbi:glycosyl hydrolase family 18 protein [Estrella lausannensis]|uniref:chitinase n=1 Tax=Estrella lausannensis TaxID=483423 RepID=A0A0H5DR49_9BACT|nr:glycosyl hydrolase family 18 protein [Estrella lausannensis]CRX38109.1 Glycoside hydrolase family protein [Estrella lausannensis]